MRSLALDEHTYFKSEILAIFRNNSDKYDVRFDEFDGNVQITENNFRKSKSYLNVRFGFRETKKGEWAVAVWSSDLAKASDDQRKQWTCLQLEEEDFPEKFDERFKKWRDRNVDGSWEVQDGPIAGLDHAVQQINALTLCALGVPLFEIKNLLSLCFPLAENAHRYEDAHSEVYKVLIDGLCKQAIKKLGEKLGVTLRADNDKTLTSLCKLIRSPPINDAVILPLRDMSKQRGHSAHNERSPNKSFSAFENFGKDIRDVVTGMEALRDYLAEELNVDIARCEERAFAMKLVPKFDRNRPVHVFDGIAEGSLKGKTVIGVKSGETSACADRPTTEALVLEFQDGSCLGLEIVSNINQVLEDGMTLPDEVALRFRATYVPPMRPYHSDDAGEEPP